MVVERWKGKDLFLSGPNFAFRHFFLTGAGVLKLLFRRMRFGGCTVIGRSSKSLSSELDFIKSNYPVEVALLAAIAAMASSTASSTSLGGGDFRFFRVLVT